MTIPSLPTDNLYKFMAMAGLSLVGFTLVFAYHVIRTGQQTILTLDNSLEEHFGRIQELKIQYRLPLNLTEVELSSIIPSEYDTAIPLRPDIRDHVDQLDKEARNDLFLAVTRLRVEHEKVDNTRQVLSDLRWNIWITVAILLLLGPLGIVVSISGFRNWSRIQRYQDAVLEKQASSNRSA